MEDVCYLLFFYANVRSIVSNDPLVDDMGKRLDELEGSIGELMTQAGIDEDLPAKQGAQEQQD